MTTLTAHPFVLEVAQTAGGRAVHVSGRLLAGAGADHPAWSGLVATGDGPDHVTLDLGGVTAIDARGVGRLLRVRQRLGARGVRLSVAVAAPRVARVLHLTGLDAVFGLASGRPVPRCVPTGGPVPLLCRCA
jgi:anti-anti-sigma factor